MSSLRTQHHLLRKVSLAGVLLLSINLVGLVVVGSTASYAATGETETFTSSQIGSSGETPQFTETGNWQLTWTYNCSYESPHVVGFGIARGSTIWGAIGVILGVFLTERT